MCGLYRDRVPELLTTPQAAKALGVTGRTLARYVQRGWLKPAVILPSGHYRWNMDEVSRQLEECRRRDREQTSRGEATT